MPCFGPLTAYHSAEVSASGKRRLVFDVKKAYSGRAIQIPCGQCVGCRLERSRQWAMRCLHEQKLHRQNCFITLTYDNDKIPEGGTLVKRDLQLFLKRLRKQFGAGIRFYACGEYGDSTARPHYHAIVFNHDFSDRKLFAQRDSKTPIFTSKVLDEIWGNGFCVVGDVTFDSAAYVARYVMKKVTGDLAAEHYSRVSPDGRIFCVLPEFTVMSRRPGIGMGWFEKFGLHAYAHDSVIVNGHEVRPPRFYDTKFELVDPDQMDYLKSRRRAVARSLAHDNTRGLHGRLSVKEKVTIASLAQKSRKL